MGNADLPFDGPEAIAVLHDITEGTFSRKLAVLAQKLGVEVPFDDLEFRSRRLVEAGDRIDDARYASAWRKAGELVAAYLTRFEEIDIWITPSLGTEPVRGGVFSPDGAWLDQRDHLVDYAGYCWIDNFTGAPSISLPMGFSDNRLPIGRPVCDRSRRGSPAACSRLSDRSCSRTVAPHATDMGRRHIGPHGFPFRIGPFSD